MVIVVISEMILLFHFSALFLFSYMTLTEGRGRLMEPPQRSSLWTRGYDSPRNNDDSGLNCGGKWVKNLLNCGGK